MVTVDDQLVISATHRELLDQVLDKWSLHIMGELCNSPKRFNELRRAIPKISPKSLSNTLRRLERNGVISRDVIAARPVSIEYSVSPLGKSMRAPVDILLAWTVEHTQEIVHAQNLFDDRVADMG